MAGQQNYLDLTLGTYKDRAEKFLSKSTEKYFLKKRFGISEEVDKDKLRHSQLLANILCSDEIDLIEWVYKRIKGETTKEKCCNKKLDDCCYESIDTCSVNNCLKWEKVEW